MGAYLVRLPQSPSGRWPSGASGVEIVHIPAFVWLGLWLALQFYGLNRAAR